jgi:GDSL-like lipase/acylhydrolase family protein
VRIAVATMLAGVLVSLLAPGASAIVEARPALLDVGDSLSVGTSPYLKQRLRAFRIWEVHDIGLHAPQAAARVGGAQVTLPRVLVVSAGTNDDPRQVGIFRRAVAVVLAAAGRKRCVVWPTIARPPFAGTTYAGFNRALAGAAQRNPNLVLVDWARLVKRHPVWLREDGVHVGAAGYRARAAAIATAVTTRCARG